jgi:hypothetical protein
MATEERGFKTVVYWQEQMLSFEPVPDIAVEKTIKKYTKQGYKAQLLTDDLIKKISQKLC